MAETATINPRIVEGLYCEALVLADEVRHAFAVGTPANAPLAAVSDDPAQAAISGEGLRTTTRMMHAIAWLLNHRAFFMGELSEFQLRRNGRLARELAHSDPAQIALLRPEIRELVRRTERFYARLGRLDRGWRQADPAAGSAIASLREKLTAQTV